MRTTDAAFYDEAMVADGSPAMLPLEDSPWLRLYEEAAKWVPRAHPVVDLGCGTGRFLCALPREGHEGERAGVDFSPAAIEVARDYLGVDADVAVADLRDWQASPVRQGNTTYVCLEVLEHLDDDRDLVRRIPPGHQFVFSVPNYESEAHLRCFREVGEVWARFDPFVTFSRWALIRLDERKAIHVLDTVRRSDAW